MPEQRFLPDVATIEFHNLPISDTVRDLVNTTIADINNESTVFDASHQIEEMMTSNSYNGIEHYILRSLDFVTGLIYSNGIEWEGESLTVGLDGSDDGTFEAHVIELARKSLQTIVDTTFAISENVLPNRLFGNGKLE